jgi:hypothetical protein
VPEMGCGAHMLALGTGTPANAAPWGSFASASMACCGRVGAAVGFGPAGNPCGTPRTRTGSLPSASAVIAQPPPHQVLCTYVSNGPSIRP